MGSDESEPEDDYDHDHDRQYVEDIPRHVGNNVPQIDYDMRGIDNGIRHSKTHERQIAHAPQYINNVSRPPYIDDPPTDNHPQHIETSQIARHTLAHGLIRSHAPTTPLAKSHAISRLPLSNERGQARQPKSSRPPTVDEMTAEDMARLQVERAVSEGRRMVQLVRRQLLSYSDF